MPTCTAVRCGFWLSGVCCLRCRRQLIPKALDVPHRNKESENMALAGKARRRKLPRKHEVKADLSNFELAKCPHFRISCRVVRESLVSYEGVVWNARS